MIRDLASPEGKAAARERLQDDDMANRMERFVSAFHAMLEARFPESDGFRGGAKVDVQVCGRGGVRVAIDAHLHRVDDESDADALADVLTALEKHSPGITDVLTQVITDVLTQER